jgi:hypothetical protein
MTAPNVPDSDLSRHLAHRADEFDRRGGSPLDISQVLDRAGEIKRGRRMRATMVMAAAVLAVAVPTALIATKGNTDKPVPPAHHVKVNTSPLSIDGLKQGEAPRVGYVTNGTFKTPSEGVVDLGAGAGQVNEVAPVAGGYVVSFANGGGDVLAHFVDQSGKVGAQEWMVSGEIAVSADGNQAAFVQPDGTPVVVYDAGASVELPKIPRGSGFGAVAAFGPDCGAHLDFESCGAWVSARGAKPETWESWSSGTVRRIAPGLRWVTAVADGRLVAGVTEVHDDLSTCSAVQTFATHKTRWTTCGHQLGPFSPDGRRVLAQPDGDGLGPTGLLVYEADSGEEVFDLPVADQGYVRQMVWEDDTHVLATIYARAQWAVVRIGLDGSREYAVAPVAATDDVESPFVLPSR